MSFSGCATFKLMLDGSWELRLNYEVASAFAAKFLFADEDFAKNQPFGGF